MATKTEPKHSEWLVMVYVAGDNNLSANSIALMQDLEAVNHTEEVRVLAAFDSATPIPQGARYLEINRTLVETHGFRTLNWPLHKDLLTPETGVVSPDFCAKPGRAASSQPQSTAEESLARFLKFVRTHYEADRYMLILYGHGNLVAGNTFLSDTNPPSFLNLDSFAKILDKDFVHKSDDNSVDKSDDKSRPIDILGFANCEMNGIETAVQLQGLVKFTIGSQGLMLALGWPFRKIVEAVGKHHALDTEAVAREILRACARNLLDFTLMERSSEQAICDVTKFGRDDKLVSAVRELSRQMQTGLEINEVQRPDINQEKGEVHFPVVRDVIRLARLEAQSYFNETFVDLYDFCELLLVKCNDILKSLNVLVKKTLLRDAIPREDGNLPRTFKKFLVDWEDLRRLEAIATAAGQVLEAFRNERVVPDAYYVCPELQYSHGLSIFFPWTLPQRPITFEPIGNHEPLRREPGSSAPPRNFRVKTPFEFYSDYEFAGSAYGDWAAFLKAFFKATLRNVRQTEDIYSEDEILFFRVSARTRNAVVPAIDLRKSDSTGESEECTCSQIKNYPRRFYISPIDCDNRAEPIFGLPGSPEPTNSNFLAPAGKVSYLGWNIRGIVAEELGLDPPVGPTPVPPEPVPE